MKNKIFFLFFSISVLFSNLTLGQESVPEAEGRTAPVAKDCYNQQTGQLCSYGSTCGAGNVDCVSNPCNNNC